MATTASGNPHATSALRDLLDHAAIHEDTGGRVSPTLVYYGLIGAGITIAAALLGLLLKHPAALHHSGFLLILKGPAASVGALLHSVSLPLLCVGALLLTIGLFLLKPRPRSAQWRHAIVGQTICGGAAASASSVFILFFIINLVLWIVIGVLTMMLLGFVLAAIADG